MIALHWPSIRGRARADLGPLLLVALVVAAVVLLAGATPPLIRSTSDDATREAVRRAADDAAVRVEAEWPDDYGPTGGRLRTPELAIDVANVGTRAEGELDESLRSALQPPVTSVSSISLAITDGSVQRRLQLEYLSTATGEPAVTWVAGRAPGASTDDEFREIPLNGPPWPVQVGLSETDAAALGVKPGDRIPVQDEQRNPYDVRVTGVFRPADVNDPVWGPAPWVLQPAANRDGFGSTRFGALLTAESVPDARLAFRTDQLRRVVRFDADPAGLTWEKAQALAASVARLKGGSAVSAERDPSLKWSTQLDNVLSDLRDQIASTTAQASVLLIAVLAVALLVIALAADLLTHRRTGALTTARHRGASLPGLATELAVESLAVTVPAALLGLALAFVLAGGAALTWVVPFVVVVVCALPAFGTLAAARATRDRRAPANRSARHWIRRTEVIRRFAVDAAVVALAAASLVALRQRGVGSTVDLPAAAPALGALAVTLLVARLLPLGTGLALRLALRSRRPLALFGAARAAAASSRALPALTLTAALALGSFALTLYATADRGLAEGAWQTTGADARLDLSSGSGSGSADDVAARAAAAPGVRHVVAAQVTENAQFIADNTAVPARLIVVDTAAFRELLADTPLPGLPALPTATDGGPVPALVRTGDGSLSPGVRFSLPVVTNQAIALTAAGTAPALGSGDDVVVIDAGAAGPEYEPNTIWATGPGAADALRKAAPGDRVTVRADLLHDRRTAPLTEGLSRLCLLTAGILLALGLLGFALAAAASAPQRWETLARLRTLGLRPRDTRRVAVGELLPPVVVAALCAPPLGALLGWLTLGPLALRLLTAQATDPVTVTPWWTITVVTVVALAVALPAIVAVEASSRRRRRLSEVLRVGG
ncbi:FtsX-like permease family protein [Paractinoplanes lichenicola]|uniref:ABC transporter permease n=1 Tax=Paractinoplanes lichenicola TaxID=2802976 RepID=A0ABS1VSZ9_9ACTN|nr:FtsX-like permease family protein [Actinoplanes lichenicola]MBL7257596.1 ABC transporter permease [Actinoplanes lichenicola]